MISKRLLIISGLVMFAILPAIVSATDREDDVSRTHKATQVFKEIMDTPDKGIPQELLKSAKCIAIIPGDVKFAFIFGGNYGVSLDGAVVQADKSGDQAMYGAEVNRNEILKGRVPIPNRRVRCCVKLMNMFKQQKPTLRAARCIRRGLTRTGNNRMEITR
jgi:lipid-binding SYLF domain-containing protein